METNEDWNEYFNTKEQHLTNKQKKSITISTDEFLRLKQKVSDITYTINQILERRVN